MHLNHEDHAKIFDLLAARALKEASMAKTAGFDSSEAYSEGMAYAYQFAAASVRDKLLEWSDERMRILDAKRPTVPSGG